MEVHIVNIQHPRSIHLHRGRGVYGNLDTEYSPRNPNTHMHQNLPGLNYNFDLPGGKIVSTVVLASYPKRCIVIASIATMSFRTSPPSSDLFS